MPILLTKDGFKRVPSLESFIGKDAEVAITQIKDQRHFIKVADCIGIIGYRNITMMREGSRLEIVCNTDRAKEVTNESIAPSEAEWHVIDIFVYEERPKPQKGRY